MFDYPCTRFLLLSSLFSPGDATLQDDSRLDRVPLGSPPEFATLRKLPPDNTDELSTDVHSETPL